MFIDTRAGVTVGTVNAATSESGHAAVLGRVSSVGVGGSSTGGGIGFPAGAHGYAIDRLRAIEVVLPSGKTVLAMRNNQYSDLFWALQGGGGQFGICTTFYQEAASEPPSAIVAVYLLLNDTATGQQAMSNTVDFFAQIKDPFSLMYYTIGVLPDSSANIPSSVGVRPVLVALQLNDSSNPNPADFATTFAPLTKKLPSTAGNTL